MLSFPCSAVQEGIGWGNRRTLIFKVMEAAFNAKLISLPAEDLLDKLSKEINILPKNRFFSLDIHNNLYPIKVFNEERFDFISVDPTREIVRAIIEYLRRRRILKTENIARNLLRLLSPRNKELQIIYIEKKRPQAGAVSSVKIAK